MFSAPPAYPVQQVGAKGAISWPEVQVVRLSADSFFRHSLLVFVAMFMIPIPAFAGEIEFSPVPGEYANTIIVTFIAPESTRIHYTLDGSEPSASSKIFTQPVTIEDDTVIRYFTVQANGLRSSVQEAFYRIRLQKPVEGEQRTIANPPAEIGRAHV